MRAVATSVHSLSVARHVLVGLAAMAVMAAAAKSASELNAEAIKLAGKGQMEAALRLFEKAQAASPKDPAMANNLGVTYMRMQRNNKAKSTFVSCLRLSPRAKDCFDNLKILLGFMKHPLGAALATAGLQDTADFFGVDMPSSRWRASPTASASGVALGEAGVRHTIKRLPRIPVGEFYLPANRDFAEGRRPFILTGLMREWSNLTDAFSFQALASEFPSAPVDFYSSNMRETGSKPFIVPLPTALRELEKPSGAYPTSTNASMYVHWNVRWGDWQRLTAKLGPSLPFFTSDESWLTGCLPSPKLRNEHLISSHWRMLLIANNGGGMFNHKDTLQTASFQYQLTGRKKWHLCSPANDALLNVTKANGEPEHNMFAPDYDTLPGLLSAECYVDTASAGEALFYPREYWHQTVNLDDVVVAITGTLVDRNNYDTVALMLDEDCEKEPKVPHISPSAELCKYYRSHCYPWWRHAFGDAETMYAAVRNKEEFDAAPTMVRPAVPRQRDLSSVPMLPTHTPGEFACGAFPFSAVEQAAPEDTGFYG